MKEVEFWKTDRAIRFGMSKYLYKPKMSKLAPKMSDFWQGGWILDVKEVKFQKNIIAIGFSSWKYLHGPNKKWVLSKNVRVFPFFLKIELSIFLRQGGWIKKNISVIGFSTCKYLYVPKKSEFSKNIYIWEFSHFS